MRFLNKTHPLLVFVSYLENKYCSFSGSVQKVIMDWPPSQSPLFIPGPGVEGQGPEEGRGFSPGTETPGHLWGLGSLPRSWSPCGFCGYGYVLLHNLTLFHPKPSSFSCWVRSDTGGVWALPPFPGCPHYSHWLASCSHGRKMTSAGDMPFHSQGPDQGRKKSNLPVFLFQCILILIFKSRQTPFSRKSVTVANWQNVCKTPRYASCVI